MEVDPGYKQTELGVIPEEWDAVELGQLAGFRTGPFGSALHKSDYTDDGVPVINPMHIVEGEIQPAPTMTVTERAAATLSDFRLKVGEIVIGRRGDMGRCAVVRTQHEGWLCGTGSMIIRCTKGLDAEFLQRVLSSPPVIAAIEDASVGTTMVNLNQGTLAKLKVPSPPLPEQRAIGEALSDVDALLGGLDRLIAKKRELKQAAMQQLLTGQIHLPGFSGKWEMSSVGHEFEIKLGKMLDAEKNVGVPKPFIGNKAVQWDRIDISDLSTVPLSPADMENFRLKQGDLLVCEGGEVGRAAIWLAPIEECYFQKALHRLRPSRGFNARFMAALLRLWSDRGVFANFVTQTSIAHLPLEKFIEMPLPVPDSEEQAAIDTVLSDMDAEIAGLEQRRGKTRALKQAMMQELLTGRTRLVKPASEMAPDAGRILEFPSSTHKTRNKHIGDAPKTNDRRANVYFMRTVLAAEIIGQLHEEPTFGHVKFEKLIFLVERLCKIETGSTYHRDAAGPYDNRALRSIDSQLRKQKWFDARKTGSRYHYVPMANRGRHKDYFERYFHAARVTFDRIVDTFRTADMEQCEIVATLFAAWEDLIRQRRSVSDEAILHEVLNNWHESKRRIAEERWRTALHWMREMGFVPEGAADNVG